MVAGYGISTEYEFASKSILIGLHTHFTPFLHNWFHYPKKYSYNDILSINLLSEFPLTKDYFGIIVSTDYAPLTLITYKTASKFSVRGISRQIKIGVDFSYYSDFPKSEYFLKPTVGFELTGRRLSELKLPRYMSHFRFVYGYNIPLHDKNIFPIPTSTFYIGYTIMRSRYKKVV